MITPNVPLEGIVVPAPVSQLFLMDCGGYEYWQEVSAKIEKAGSFITALPVKTRASDDEFLLPFEIKSIDSMEPERVVFTALYGEKVLYCAYLCGGKWPHGGEFSTNKYSFSLANV